MKNRSESTPMDPTSFERTVLPNGVRLHINSSPKMKTVLVRADFGGNLDGDVTRRALIPMILRRGTRRFPDMKSMNRHLEGLYGASVVTDVTKIGEWHTLKFTLELVNDVFIPGGKGVVRDGLEFLRELIWEPRATGDSFDPEYVTQEKTNLQRTIEGLVDDKGHYALERCIREMCAGEEFRRFEIGDLADLEGIDARALHGTWRHLVDRAPLDVYISGDIDVSAARDLLREIFGHPRRGDLLLSSRPAEVAVGEPRSVQERMDVNQCRLVLGYRHGVTYFGGDLEGLVMMNGVLGSFSHSKLFQNVREKASLAYDAHSALEKTKGLLFVSCGIAAENHGKVLEIIAEQIRALQEGDVSDVELTATRESFLNHLTMMEDSPSEIMEVDRVWRLHGREFDLGRYREGLKDVGRDRIAACASKLRLDTEFFLRS